MNTNTNNLTPGHNACSGCGQLSAVQSVMRALDKDTILVNSTGCLEVTTTAHPQSAWNLPWMHSLFENSAAVGSGIKAALRKKKKKTKVVIQAGDGATYDIGIGFLSGLFERGDDVVYICYDTEAYSNTGIQASGSTPAGAKTTTTPSGANEVKKDMLAIALAHGVKYVAQSTAAFPDDITVKVKKALQAEGPAYIQILSPCIPGWKIKTNESIKAARLAVQTGLYPLLEYQNGKLSGSSINKNFQPTKIEEYIQMQGRFNGTNQTEIKAMNKIVIDNIKKYSL